MASKIYLAVIGEPTISSILLPPFNINDSCSHWYTWFFNMMFLFPFMLPPAYGLLYEVNDFFFLNQIVTSRAS